MMSNEQLDKILKWICENDNNNSIPTAMTIEDWGLTRTSEEESKAYFGKFLTEAFISNNIDISLIDKVAEKFQSRGLISYTKRNENDFVFKVNLEAHEFWNKGKGGFLKEKKRKRRKIVWGIIITILTLGLAGLAINWKDIFRI